MELGPIIKSYLKVISKHGDFPNSISLLTRGYMDEFYGLFWMVMVDVDRTW